MKVDQALLSFGQLPFLQSLDTNDTYNCAHPDWESILEIAPSLSTIRGLAFPSSNWSHPTAKSLQCIQSDEKLIDIISSLPQLESLKALRISSPQFRLPYRIMEPPDFEKGKAGIQHFTYCYTLDLESLHLISQMANLTILTISFDPMLVAIEELFKVFQGLPLLRKLSVSMNTIFGDLEKGEGKVVPLVQVRHLSLHSHSARDSDSEQQHANLFATLEDRFINVQDLDLRGFYSVPSITFIESLKQLRHLDIWVHTHRSARTATMASASLETIKLTGAPEAIFHTLTGSQIPRLARLTVSITTDYVWYPEEIVLTPGTFQHLTYIFAQSTMNWRIADLLSLQIIKLHGYSQGEQSRVSDFLVQLIQNPYICPKLNEIGFLEAPEWDLLFIMLERRNFLPLKSRVSPISTITLYSLPSPVLLIPLAELLNCRFVAVPSYRQLSLLVLIGSYFDKSM